MGEAADATARRSTPSDRCLNRDVLAPVIGARRANCRFSRRKSALDRIVETDLGRQCSAFVFRLPRDRAANIFWPAHATKRYPRQASRYLVEGTEAGLDQARRTVPRGIEAQRARAIAVLVRPSVCNVLQRLQDRSHSGCVRAATEGPLTNHSHVAYDCIRGATASTSSHRVRRPHP